MFIKKPYYSEHKTEESLSYSHLYHLSFIILLIGTINSKAPAFIAGAN